MRFRARARVRVKVRVRVRVTSLESRSKLHAEMLFMRWRVRSAVTRSSWLAKLGPWRTFN